MLASKLELAEQFGATHIVDASAGDPVGQVRDLAGGGVHYSFEAIGMKQTSEQAFGMLRAGGTCTVIGMMPVGQSGESAVYEVEAEGRRIGTNMGSNRFRVDMPRYVDMYLQGRLKLDELVSARIKLEDANQGFAAMKAGEVARSVIMFD
jgi:S-(hydroxymethyl)glutathione dehydrogenase/alcohol dehydrogenase